MPSWAEIKAKSRAKVHQTFAVACLYTDGDVTDVPLTVRYHSRLVTHGALNEDGYAEVIEGITRLVFQSTELAAALDGAGIELMAGGQVSLTDYGYVFSLDKLVEPDGPLNVTWDVTLRRQ